MEIKLYSFEVFVAFFAATDDEKISLKEIVKESAKSDCEETQRTDSLKKKKELHAYY